MLDNIIGISFVALANLALWVKLLDKKVNFKSFRLYFGMLFMITLLLINFFMINELIKTITVILIVTISIKIVFDVDLRKSLLAAIFNQLLFIISEIIVIVIFLMIKNIDNNNILVNSLFGTIYANIPVSLLVVFFSRLSIVKSLYHKILDLIKSQKIYSVIFLALLVTSIASIVFNLIYYTNDLVLLSCFGLAVLAGALIFVIKSMIIRNRYLNMHIKYNNTLETLKSYEDIMDKYKVSNHENKNQLLMIRNMLKKDTKNDVSKYIDKIVENEYKDDEHLMMETSKIPSGGLRALVYSKLLYMKNNKINFDLKVDRKVRNVEFSDSDQELILDICKAVGVFLDNSIEAVKSLKDGSVSIELYMLDEKFNISIANNFDGGIELDRIDELKYTSKGDGHGYGLSLVKTIINKNSRLENIRKINDNVFVQILKIKI